MSDSKECIDFDDTNKEVPSTKDVLLNLADDDIVIVSETVDEIYIDENDYISSDDVEEIEGSENFDLIYKMNTNKHRQEGKHQLPRDTIFKGKLPEKDDENKDNHQSDSNSYDISNIFDMQYNDNDDYLNQNNLTKDVYKILNEKTKLDFKQNRRKPNKDVFNNYYNLLIRELGFRYTKSEIFVELSYYFTDNIFNMFKLLDKKPANAIIKELMQKGYLRNISGINFL